MSHRYAVGDVVVGRSLAVPPGPYLIVRLLPSIQGEPQYHGRSKVDGHHRALLEGQIKAVMKSEPPKIDQSSAQHRALR